MIERLIKPGTMWINERHEVVIYVGRQDHSLCGGTWLHKELSMGWYDENDVPALCLCQFVEC